MASPPPSRRILIADADPRVVSEFKHALGERKEFEIHAYTSGRSACDALRETAYDLIIADWNMPEVDGLTLIRQAQERSDQTITVLTSANDSAETRAQLEDASAHHYLEKPFSLEELVHTIDAIFPRQASLEEKTSLVLKVILGGDANVGKTSLIRRYRTGEFDASRDMTIGVDFHLYDLDVADEPVRMVVWDLGGQERFNSARYAFYRGSQAVGLVFDASNRASFYNLIRWWREVRQHLPDVPVILLANKTDLPRQVSADEATQVAQALDAPFFESSCASGDGVASFFQALAFQAWKNALRHQTVAARE